MTCARMPTTSSATATSWAAEASGSTTPRCRSGSSSSSACRLETIQRTASALLLQAFTYGVPPHGGIAPGIDRIVMMLGGTDNIRDVIAFPKTQSMAGPDARSAPARSIPAQLEELRDSGGSTAEEAGLVVLAGSRRAAGDVRVAQLDSIRDPGVRKADQMPARSISEDGTWKAKAGDPPELAQDNPPPWSGGSTLAFSPGAGRGWRSRHGARRLAFWVLVASSSRSSSSPSCPTGAAPICRSF